MDDMKLPFHSAFACFIGGESAALETLDDDGDGCALFQDDERLLAGLLKQMADIGHNQGEAGFWDAQALLCRIVGLLLRSKPIGDGARSISSLPTPDETSETFSLRVNRLIEGEPASNIPLEELARRLSVSVSTLTHLYKRETGESVVRARTRLRMERVKRFLSMGTPLKHIAEDLGFCDVYHLSKTFKRLFGKSPRRFVKDASPDTFN